MICIENMVENSLIDMCFIAAMKGNNNFPGILHQNSLAKHCLVFLISIVIKAIKGDFVCYKRKQNLVSLQYFAATGHHALQNLIFYVGLHEVAYRRPLA